MCIKHKILLIFIVIFFSMFAVTKVEAATLNRYRIEYESVVLDEDDNIKTILPSNTVVKVVKNYSNGNSKINYYEKEKATKTMTGYISTNVLTEIEPTEKMTVIKVTSDSKKIIEKKIAIVQLAQEIEAMGIGYDQLNRNNFYENFGKIEQVKGDTIFKKIQSLIKNIKKGGNLSRKVDCSSLCATIYNRIFGIDFYRDSGKTNIMIVDDFEKNADDELKYVGTNIKKEKVFKIIKRIKDKKGNLNTKNLQIGDVILIGKTNRKREYEHISMYIGNGKIVEAIFRDGGLEVGKQKINRVIIRDLPTYYYTTSIGGGAGEWSRICQLRLIDSIWK